jgi:H/ACA ribonucleoprotein complex subunit 4
MEKQQEDWNIDLNRSIIIIDKPAGPTSFQVTDFIKKSLNLNKASHFGTLDPAVTGVLPIALGRAARLTGYFSKQDKEYVGVMHLHEDIAKQDIEETIKQKFLGKIKQLPPVKSRVRRELREREIKKFVILEKQGRDVLFSVKCEAGTYIRKLVHDLGNELKIGAHMTELRRTRASIFEEKDSINLYEFQKAVKDYKDGNPEKLEKILVPIEIIKRIVPSIEVKKEAIERLKHGSPLFIDMIKKYQSFNNNDFIGIFYKDKLLEVAQAIVSSQNIRLIKSNSIIAKPRTVFN